MLKYRHPTVDDLPKINKWITEDSDHRSKCDGSYFVLMLDKDGNLPKGMQCIEVLDEQGTVFFLKFTNALIVDTQFAPESEVSKDRVRIALKEAFGFFSISSKNLGYHAMLFESVSKSLIWFFQKLGFKQEFDFFKVNL